MVLVNEWWTIRILRFCCISVFLLRIFTFGIFAVLETQRVSVLIHHVDRSGHFLEQINFTHSIKFMLEMDSTQRLISG